MDERLNWKIVIKSSAIWINKHEFHAYNTLVSIMFAMMLELSRLWAAHLFMEHFGGFQRFNSLRENWVLAILSAEIHPKCPDSGECSSQTKYLTLLHSE